MTGKERFVISVRVIGAVYRDTPKLKMFMISVMWSDQTEVIVYRSFQDFKKFHRLLKRRFPLLNPFRRKDRVIPTFRGKISLLQKGSKRSMRRMKFLEHYCEKLLKCDPTVTQSSELTQFFMPKEHDLQSDFTRNSIIVLMSEELPDGPNGGGGHMTDQAGSVTHPFITQTYCCVAAYETKDTKNRPFEVKVDEKLDVLIKDPAGWWLVENEEKRLAWFPAPYLELCDGEDNDDAGFQLVGALYCAVKSYSTKKDDEVSVTIGSVVEVLKKSDNGWWLIRFNGKGGYIPSMYLRPYNNPRAGLYSLQRKLHTSTLNLATSMESSYPPIPTGENCPLHDSAAQSGGIPARLHKAQSLDVLSEIRTQTSLEANTSAPECRERSMTNTSSELSFSSFSSSSDSSSSLKEGRGSESENSSPTPNLLEHHGSIASSQSSASATSKGSKTPSAAPRVPPRPKTEEILNRCTTMTRNAALATKTRLRIQSESPQSR